MTTGLDRLRFTGWEVPYWGSCVNCGCEIKITLVVPNDATRAPDSIEIGCSCRMGYCGVECLRSGSPRPPLPLEVEHRGGDDGAGSYPPQPSDRPSSRWERLVGPWRRV